ncbi:hypothetical protein LZK73_34835 (plasmid) [Neorhizobium galegae]|nr:hypothetical protein LZK73_34835 [Neorhizobium galegae]
MRQFFNSKYKIILAAALFILTSIFMSISATGHVSGNYIAIVLVAFLFTILSLYSTARSQHAEYLIIGSLLLSLSTLVGITEVLTKKISNMEYGIYFFAFLGCVGLLSLGLIARYLTSEGWGVSSEKNPRSAVGLRHDPRIRAGDRLGFRADLKSPAFRQY